MLFYTVQSSDCTIHTFSQIGKELVNNFIGHSYENINTEGLLMEQIVSTNKIVTLFQDQKSAGDTFWVLVLELSTNTVTDAFQAQSDFVPIQVRSFIDGTHDKMMIYGYDGTNFYRLIVSI